MLSRYSFDKILIILNLVLWSFEALSSEHMVIELLLCMSPVRLVCVLSETCVLFISSPILLQCAIEHFAGNKLWEVWNN